MRDSGIEWVPTIPDGWQTIPYKHVFEEIERPARDGDEIITCFRDGEVTLRRNRREDGFTVAEQESGYQHISKGDLVVHGMDGFAGAIGISDSDGKATPVLIVMNPRHGACSRYFMYQLRAYAYLEVFLATSSGIRVRSCSLNWKKLGNLPAIVPPLEEQRRIADYLDERCIAIDSAKHVIEGEVDALRRLRKAEIHKAATKGLNGSVSMRDSGVEWIGDIPAAWELPRFKTVYRQVKRTGYPDEELLSVYLNYGVIRFSDDDGVRVHKTSSDTSEYQLVLPGDLVMNNQQAWRGSVGVSSLRGIVSPAYHVYQSCDSSIVNARYANYLFRSCMVPAYELCSHGVGTIQRNISPEEFSYERIPLPPLEEQRHVADHLDERCTAIDSAIDARTKQLERLEDYRKSLIYAFATGKKEVPAS